MLKAYNISSNAIFKNIMIHNKFLVDFIDSEKPEPYKNPKTSLA
jgi:hypothetical protein